LKSSSRTLRNLVGHRPRPIRVDLDRQTVQLLHLALEPLQLGDEPFAAEDGRAEIDREPSRGRHRHLDPRPGLREVVEQELIPGAFQPPADHA
jgi:hypothetical protein